MLNPQRQRFCEEYVVDLNGTQAAIRAGYSERTANEQAARLLANVSVREYIHELQNKRRKDIEVRADRVLQTLEYVAYADVAELFDEEGDLKAPSEWPDEIRPLIAGVEVTENTDKDGNTKRTIKVKMVDRMKALDLLARHKGLLVERVEVKLEEGVSARLERARRAAAADPVAVTFDKSIKGGYLDNNPGIGSDKNTD